MERLKTENKVVGRKQSEKAIKAGLAEIVFVADDADTWVTQPILDLCTAQHLPVQTVSSMRELAKACHVEVATAVAVLLNDKAK